MKRISSNKYAGNKKSKVNDGTLHLMSSEPNRVRLQNAIGEMNRGVYFDYKLIK
jgi:hypothetical protein